MAAGICNVQSAYLVTPAKPNAITVTYRYWRAVWFFRANSHYYAGRLVQTELPVGAVETHPRYDVKPRLWFSADGNFWYGGATSLNGAENTNTTQKNSRIGATPSIPLGNHQSLKFSYSAGAYIRFGGDYQNISAAWQYSWVHEPK